MPWSLDGGKTTGCCFCCWPCLLTMYAVCNIFTWQQQFGKFCECFNRFCCTYGNCWLDLLTLNGAALQGGGVTQLIMGSALFPLFEFIYAYEDEDDPEDSTTSSELAWRTVFIVPTVVSLVTAYVIVYHADDSPKGKRIYICSDLTLLRHVETNNRTTL